MIIEGMVKNVPARNFQDLIVWQQAHKWVINTYNYSKTFPKDELFGLTSQLRRSAVSITANIAEGFKRRGKSDKARFFNIAQSSLEESRYYLILSHDLCYGDSRQLLTELDIISKMLDKYYTSLCLSKEQNAAQER